MCLFVLFLFALVLIEIAYFTTGQRGCTILLFGNEKFVKNRKSNHRTYWICSRKVSIYYCFIYYCTSDTIQIYISLNDYYLLDNLTSHHLI